MDKSNEKEIENFVKEVKEIGEGWRFCRLSPDSIKSYIAMEPSDLMKEYLSLYFIVEIYCQSSIRDCQELDIMECVADRFWSQQEQEEFNKQVWELIEADHSSILRELAGEEAVDEWNLKRERILNSKKEKGC
jgi:hypothetical protein